MKERIQIKIPQENIRNKKSFKTSGKIKREKQKNIPKFSKFVSDTTIDHTKLTKNKKK